MTILRSLRVLWVCVLLFAVSSLSALASYGVEPTIETAVTSDGIHLKAKRYANPGAVPILLIHGLGTNERSWDLDSGNGSFAQLLHEAGFDVWLGNLRGFGSGGVRSQTPSDLASWSVDYYAAADMPAFVNLVREQTGQAPWLMGHSAGVWSIEGFLGGAHLDDSGNILGGEAFRQNAQSKIRGFVAITGVHNLWWPKSVKNALFDPVLTIRDYFRANYEAELLAESDLLYSFLAEARPFPLSVMHDVSNLPLAQIPFLGATLAMLYRSVVDVLAVSPIMNLFYHTPNTDGSTVRRLSRDGIEDVPMRVVEQCGNTIREREALGYYHMRKPRNAFAYGDYRASFRLPALFVAGGRDRLVSPESVYRDGYLSNGSPDKNFIRVEQSGHLDILIGRNTRTEVIEPVIRWLKQRS